MSGLISSKYNYEFTSIDGKPLILNGLSSTIIEAPPGGLQGPELSPEDRSVLIEHHFLHVPEEDQRALLVKRTLQERLDPSRVEITLQMHEECNFRCTYCNQDFRNQAFDDPLQARLVAYLKTHLPPQGSLLVHYYGGEPLLAWKYLVHLDHSILDLTTEIGADYQFYITTNGSLLTEDKIDYLARRKVAYVKITLDGPPEIHDRRRIQAGGQPTFHKVLHNVLAAAPRIPVYVRVNVDGSNLSHVPELLDLLANRLRDAGPGPQAVTLDFNIVYNGRERRLALDVSYLHVHELQLQAIAAGFKVRLPPVVRHRHCGFNSVNTALIDTDGGVYVCEKRPELQADQLPELTEPATSGATTTGAVATSPGKHKRLPMFQGNARDDFVPVRADCQVCPILPLCGGGCSLLALGKDAPPCPPWKHDVEKYLQIHHQVNGFDM
jgi:uncharacterized protein